MGKPLPGVEIRIVHPTTGEEVPPGTVGELWVRSDVVVVPEAPMSDGGGGGAGDRASDGDSASASDGARDGATPPGWFRTGDMVSADREGYLYPAGRLSDTINRGGERFVPAEVEDVVRAHPAVRDVAAFGVPDPEMGHRVGVAVVVSEPVDLQQLREFCQGRIANFSSPSACWCSPSCPSPTSGRWTARTCAPGSRNR